MQRDGLARIARPRLAACTNAWIWDWKMWEDRTQGLHWEQKMRSFKVEAAEERRQLEDIIKDLERQLREHGLLASQPIPPPDPRVLLIHDIHARGVPQDPDEKTGTDPYARFVLLDSGPGVKRQTAFTSFRCLPSAAAT